MPCSVLFEADLPACTGSIILDAGLNADTEYLVKITDKFDHVYGKTYLSDEDGKITIDEEEEVEGVRLYPAQLFNPYAGSFTLKVYTDDDNYCVAEKLTLCEAEYDGVVMKFHKTTVADLVAEIKCCETC